jgi:transposase IS116/IS110/IS902 family protein
VGRRDRPEVVVGRRDRPEPGRRRGPVPRRRRGRPPALLGLCGPGRVPRRTNATCPACWRPTPRRRPASWRPGSPAYSWPRSRCLARSRRATAAVWQRVVAGELFVPALAYAVGTLTRPPGPGPRSVCRGCARLTSRTPTADQILDAHPLAEVLTLRCPASVSGPPPESCSESATARHFATPGHLAAYAGLTPVTRRSGTSIRGEHPPKGGNKHPNARSSSPRSPRWRIRRRGPTTTAKCATRRCTIEWR